MAPRDIVLALMLAMMWGSTFTAMKIGVADAPPLLVNAFRFLLSAFPAVLLVRRPSVPLVPLAGFALVLFVTKFSVLFFAIKLGMPAGLASIVLQMQVFFTIAFAFVLVRERPARHQILGGGIAFFGMVLIGIEKFENAAVLPLLLCLLAAALWGGANMIIKKTRVPDMMAFVVWSSAIAGPVLFALSLVVDGPGVIVPILSAPGWPVVLAVLYLAFGGTLFGYWVWNSLVARYPVALVGPFALLIPVSGMACGVLFLGETMSVATIIASAVVFIGLVINVFGARLIGLIRAAS